MNRPSVALALAAASGAAGLAHQLLWVRRMIDIQGADAGTFARVVGAFFLGLALGAWLASRRIPSRPWIGVAAVEALVAALALGVLGAGQITWLGALPPFAAWLLPIVLILPPAAAMGAVLPWMIHAAGSRHSVALYAANTLGGIAGLLLTVSWSLPALGLAGASALSIGINLLIAVAAWRISGTTHAPVLERSPARASDPGIDTLAFASGFLVLASEVIFRHQLAQLLISSHFAGAIVLAAVLAALGLSAAIVASFPRMDPGFLPLALLASAAACAIQPLAVVFQRGGVRYLSFDQPISSYLVEAAALALPAVALVLIPAGFVFPLLLRSAAHRGIDAGRLLALNGLGGWFGAELGERLLAPTLGLWLPMAAIGAGYLACAWPQTFRFRLPAAIAILLVLAGGVWTSVRLPWAGLRGSDRIEKTSLGREGVVAVVTGAPDDRRLLMNNSYTLGGSRAALNQERQILLPMLLHGDARRVATLGVATGSTLAGATTDPAMEFAEGIDLSPLVLRAAREDFARFNRHMADDPRVRLTHGDARHVIRQRRGEFDVIVGDLFLPWNTGEGRLFTHEHFASVRAALRPGGLFCQWLPMYQLTKSQLDAIVRTFRSVFPDAWIVRGDFYASMPIVGLVGGIPLDAIDWSAVETACKRLRTAGECRDPLLRHAEGVAMLVEGLAPEPPTGPRITLANSWLEWDAARNVIGGAQPWFVGVPLAAWLRDASAAGRDRLPVRLHAAHRAGEMLATLEIARATKLPEAAAMEESLRRDFPEAILDDVDAIRNRWPMRHPPGFL